MQVFGVNWEHQLNIWTKLKTILIFHSQSYKIISMITFKDVKLSFFFFIGGNEPFFYLSNQIFNFFILE